MNWLDNLKAQFVLNFVEDNRWFLLVQGVGNTILITAVALLIGVVLGALVAMVRSTYDKNGEDMKTRHKCSYNLLFVCNGNLFYRNIFSIYFHECKSDLLVKTPFPTASWIQPYPVINTLFRIFVGMPKYDHINIS